MYTAVSGVSLTSFELQDLVSRQTINDVGFGNFTPKKVIIFPFLSCSFTVAKSRRDDNSNRYTSVGMHDLQDSYPPSPPLPTEDDYLSGLLRVRVMSASDLKAKLGWGLS